MAQSLRMPSIILVTLMLFSTIAVHLAISDPQNLTPNEPTSESGPNSMEVLILGNSYTQGNNLDSLTESLLQNDVANANADRLAAGGLNLHDHATRAQTAGHQWNTTLNSGNWDWVVLQDQSQIPSFPTSGQYWQNSKAGAEVLNEIIKDNGGETVLLMTWGRRNGDQDNLWRNPDFLTMQANLDSGYRLYAENVTTPARPVWIAPAGLAFKYIYDDITASGGTPENSGTLFHDLYSSDGSHPSLSGSYLASCVIYATITGYNPVGIGGPSGLSSTRILELQEAAAATVFNETQNLVYPWHNIASTTFAYGNTSVVLHPALNETTALTHRPGKRVDNATMDLTMEGMLEWNNASNGMIQLSPNSTFTNTTVDANGNLRLLTGTTADHYNGNFTSPIFGQQGIFYLNSTVAIPNNQPANTYIGGTYHYSVDGTTWSSWLPLNISGELLPPFTIIQFRLWLSTTNNSTTPTASSIDLNMSNWLSIDDFDLSISSTPTLNPIIAFSQEIGAVRNSTMTIPPFSGSPTFHIYVPTNSTPIDSAWFHLSPPQFFIHGGISISLNGKNILTINSSNIPEMGMTIEINKTILQANWPTSPSINNDIGGIAWSDLPITVSTSLGYPGSFSNPLMVIPYRLTQTLGSNGSIVNALNNHVSQTSGSWSFAAFSTFPVICSGTALDSHSVLLDSLTIDFIDDIPPTVTNISFYVDGQEVSEARIGDLVEIRVRVFGNESDATVEWNFQGLGSISSWPPSSLSSMTWDTSHNSYHGYYDTSQHSSEYGDSMALWLWLTDAEGTFDFPSGVGAWYTYLVLKPVYPEFKTIEVSGCNEVLVTICNAEAGTEIVFQASAVEGRSDFATFAHIVNPSDASDEFVVPLFWQASSNMYEGSTSLTPAELGWWDIMFRFIDVNRAEGNWSNASISKLHLIDETAPDEGTLIVVKDQSEDSSWNIKGEWLATIADNSSASITVNGPNNFEASIPFSTVIAHDSMNVTSYVALGSTETMGYGASNPENSVIGLIHSQLEQTWSEVTLMNISDSWGTVQNFIIEKDQIIIANPDIITIIPLRDYSSSSTSVWRTNYPMLLDDLASTGAQIYIGVLQLDPDYVCHIGSGPGGCHSYGEYEMVVEKTEILTEIASTRPWVTLVPLSDEGPEHPEWRDSNNDFTDAGHASLAASFLHMIESSSMRTVNYEGRHLLDTSNLDPGTYEFEMEVVDEAGNIAVDAVAGADAVQFIAPADGILSLSILTPSTSVLHPGDFDIEYNADCVIGCTMLLQVSIDGEIVQTLQPSSGVNSITVQISSIGAHTISMNLSTLDWDVPFIIEGLEIYATPAPVPEWHIACTYHEEEATQFGIAYKGEIGNLTTSTHHIECSLTNSGEVSGSVQVSPDATTDPYDCTFSASQVSPNSQALFYCTAEESDETSGVHQLSLAFEGVTDTVNNSIGAWNTTSVLVSPRFEKAEQADGVDSNQGGDSSTDVSGKGPSTWILSAIILILIGIGAISVMFTMRDRKEAIIGVVNEDSLFKDDFTSDTELSDFGVLHPVMTETQEIVSQEIQRVESYLDLPSSGEYEEVGDKTIYIQSDGVKWEQEDGGSYRRLSE